MLIWGSYPKIAKDESVRFNIECPACQSTNTFLVILNRKPHLFFIPLPFLEYGDEPGFYCRDCNSKFVFGGSDEAQVVAHVVEQYYLGKINRDEIPDIISLVDLKNKLK